ncbi:MAG: N-acetyltransferase [Armatimonadetes bacterium]|nr:N-acetyltransferase [Armatimonadota bacterium]
MPNPVKNQVWHPEKSNIYSDQIGENCNIAAMVEIQRGASIGRDCRIGAFSFIPQGVHIGNEVFVGPGTVFTNDLFPNAAEANRGEWTMVETFVEDGVAIGANSTILCGLRISTGALIGAGSVVTRDVPPHAVVAGNPARVVKYRKPEES